jgi:hypothetical protein
MQHESCNGDSFHVRVYSYYTKSYSIAENICTGYAAPQDAIKAWLMDGTPPASDRSGYDGHRKNIMNGIYHDLGCGYAYGPVQYRHFWVQDFGGGRPDYFPVAAGAHLFLESGKTTFTASYYDSVLRAPPREAAVVVEGVSTPLSLELGSAAKGTYSAAIARGTACRQYYFVFRDANGVNWRYPESASLVTYGEGTCAPVSEKGKPAAALSGVTASPNPSSGFAEIRCRFPSVKGPAVLSVHDAKGRQWLCRRFDSGVFQCRWNSRAPAGLYIIRISCGGREECRKIVIIR